MDMPYRHRIVVPLQGFKQTICSPFFIFYNLVTAEVFPPYVTGLMRIELLDLPVL